MRNLKIKFINFVGVNGDEETIAVQEIDTSTVSAEDAADLIMKVISTIQWGDMKKED